MYIIIIIIIIIIIVVVIIIIIVVVVRVQVIEFESTALMIGQLGLRVNLIAYPVVSVKKVSLAL